MFTREQLKEIQTLDQGRMEYHFACVTQSQFKRGTPSAVDARLYEIYKDAYGKKLTLNSCKTCQFNNYLEVARAYNESKKFYEELDEKQAGNEIVEMISEMADLEKPTKNNKPKGRPKKTTKK